MINTIVYFKLYVLKGNRILTSILERKKLNKVNILFEILERVPSCTEVPEHNFGSFRIQCTTEISLKASAVNACRIPSNFNKKVFQKIISVDFWKKFLSRRLSRKRCQNKVRYSLHIPPISLKPLM